jgi:hypothetical protein
MERRMAAASAFRTRQLQERARKKVQPTVHVQVHVRLQPEGRAPLLKPEGQAQVPAPLT